MNFWKNEMSFEVGNNDPYLFLFGFCTLKFGLGYKVPTILYSLAFGS